MLPEKTDQVLEAKLTHEVFRLKTQQQIAKDFGSHGFQFHSKFIKDAYCISDLVQTVSEAMVEIIEKRPNSWHPLLYTMDVSENTYLKLATSQNPTWIEEFTWIVIRREALKVFFREQYS